MFFPRGRIVWMSELHLINQLQLAAIRRNHKAYIFHKVPQGQHLHNRYEPIKHQANSLDNLKITLFCLHPLICSVSGGHTPCPPVTHCTISVPPSQPAPVFSPSLHSPYGARLMAALSNTQLPIMVTSHMSLNIHCELWQHAERTAWGWTFSKSRTSSSIKCIRRVVKKLRRRNRKMWEKLVIFKSY